MSISIAVVKWSVLFPYFGLNNVKDIIKRFTYIDVCEIRGKVLLTRVGIPERLE